MNQFLTLDNPLRGCKINQIEMSCAWWRYSNIHLCKIWK